MKLKVVFYASAKPREIMLAKALTEGCRRHGDELEIRWTSDYGENEQGDDLKYPGPSQDTHVACTFGVKGKSLWIMRDHLAVGKSTLLLDKGYTRQKGNDEAGHTLYSRISINAGDPSDYMMLKKRSGDRWDQTKITPVEHQPKPSSGTVLICGSSAKYHTFHGLEEPTQWAQNLIRKLLKMTRRHIIYRPKASAKLPPIQGASYSGPGSSIRDALRGCHVMITYGSGAAIDAMVAGIPIIALGKSVGSPVAEKELENIETPFWPDPLLRSKWFNAVAYCQWTTEELRTGEAWEDLKQEVVRQGRL